MAHPDYPKQPPTPERARPAEQKPINDIGDFALLAEFQAEKIERNALQAEGEINKKKLSKQAEQMKRVTDIIKELAQAEVSMDEALKEIKESIEYFEKQMMTNISDDESNEFERQKNDYEAAQQFITQNKDWNFTQVKDFSEWNKERNARLEEKRVRKQREEEGAREAQTAKQIEGVYKKLGVESPTEREKSRERAAEIVLADGGVNVHMSVRKEVSAAAYQTGFQNLMTRINADPRRYSPNEALSQIEAQLVAGNDLMRGKRRDDVLKERGVKEVIDIRHLTKLVEEEVSPAKKGFLGSRLGAKKAEKQYRQEPVLHNEKVVNGEKEPAVRFTYYIPQQTEWGDYSGRPGQSMMVDIILPESKAKELERIIESDPAAMRKIVERVMKEKVLKQSSQWEAKQQAGDALRPPYEQWDSSGAKIYLQKEGMGAGFHEEALKKVQK